MEDAYDMDGGGEIDYNDIQFDGSGSSAVHDADRVPLFEEDDDDDGDDGDDEARHQTLLELAQGPKRDTAMYEIENRTYKIAVLMNFISIALAISSGGPMPHTFDSDTRRIIEEYPKLNVRMAGNRPPPFVYDHGSSTANPDDPDAV